MVKLTKIYTKKGDTGCTSLAGNIRINKTALSVQALGELDELNALLGFAACAITTTTLIELHQKILRIQNELFNLGAEIAVPLSKRRTNTPHITAADITRLENEIDTMNKELNSLSSFILPGGSEISARIHLARTVCRRAERTIIALGKKMKLDKEIIPYINRLSDWLFVAARYSNKKLNSEEILWHYEI